MQVYLNLNLAQVPMLASILVTLTFVSTRIRRYFIRREFARRHGCQSAVRANKDLLLGLDQILPLVHDIGKHRLLETMWKRYHLYGNTYTSKRVLNPGIYTVEPENIKTILSTNFKDYGLGHRAQHYEPLLGRGIFDTDGDHWATSRALLRPSFTRNKVADLKSFEHLIPDLFALIPRDGETVVDLQDLFFRYTMDSATAFLFGQSVGSLRMDQSDLSFAPAFNYALEAIWMSLILGPFRIFKRDQKAEQCYRICREFAERFVEDAVKAVRSGKDETKRESYIFSHELARNTADKRRILDELLNILLAGRDTTASLLSNMFFMLAKYPAIWDKLRREVASLEGRLPTYEELRNLKYLRCCMNESLRLHPVVPLNERLAMKDTVLPLGGGKDGLSPVFVAKGTQVAYNVYGMHRRTDLYGPDAEEFRPERWEDGQLNPRWEYLPFNGGPRICIGQQYALAEVGYVTVRMAQEFQTLKSRDPGPWEESLRLTLCSRNGTKVSLTPA
ncbi:cytochrome P450 [Aspergillus sclerotioniger CBS 115572]|uniref:Cytochrome P450 n=1 Tax=Aspergillus sclerotioniger CBS 115572 TaxID=1450535 RepID=A0A317URZ4_9EURO|nr:cytochrome P450 [Aspergillus sclerotioniger CBS 115572]PWY64734.1 cytochrome P450 [Aspergillus sclerotioniger CBS 115572]